VANFSAISRSCFHGSKWPVTLAHLAVSKCADHTPIYRLEKAFQRQGIPVARSTMNVSVRRNASRAPSGVSLSDETVLVKRVAP
jgi:transposase